MKKIYRAGSVLLSAFMLLTACSTQTTSSSQSTSGTTASSSTAESAASESAPAADAVVFPLAEPLKLTYWAGMTPNISTTAKNFGEIELFQKLKEMTNIEFEFIHPAIGEEDKAFNLMVASGEYPDILEYSYEKYPGGAFGALDDGVIVPLNDVLDYAPNFKKLIEEIPEINATVRNENGEYAAFPFIKPRNVVNWGYLIREDLLKEAGMEVPETIDELYAVLKKFKEMGVKSPMFLSNNNKTRSLKQNNGINSLLGAWNTAYGYFADNGTIHFGPAEPQFKEFLTVMNQWYKEGLIDQEFAGANSQDEFEKRVFTNAEVGVFSHNIGPVERAYTLGRTNTPDYTLKPIPPLVMEEGQENRFVWYMNVVEISRCISISSQSEHAKEIAAFADIGYGEEGSMLYSLGIEGESYEIKDGKATITDAIYNNPYDAPMTAALYRYCRGMDGGSYLLDESFYTAYWSLPEQQEMVEVNKKFADATAKNDPNVYGTLTADESSALGSKITDIETYVDEMFIKFVTGETPLTEFDAYVEQIEKIGLEDVLSARQAAHDRYLASLQ